MELNREFGTSLVIVTMTAGPRGAHGTAHRCSKTEFWSQRRLIAPQPRMAGGHAAVHPVQGN